MWCFNGVALEVGDECEDMVDGQECFQCFFPLLEQLSWKLTGIAGLGGSSSCHVSLLPISATRIRE